MGARGTGGVCRIGSAGSVARSIFGLMFVSWFEGGAGTVFVIACLLIQLSGEKIPQ